MSLKKKENHLDRNFGNYLLVYMFITVIVFITFGVFENLIESEFVKLVGTIVSILICSYLITSLVYLFVVFCIGVGKIIKKGGE